MAEKDLKETLKEMTNRKAIKIVEEFIQAIKQSSLKNSSLKNSSLGNSSLGNSSLGNLKSFEVDFYDFAEGVGRMYLATTDNEFDAFVDVLERAIYKKNGSIVEFKRKFLKDENFSVINVELDSLLKKLLEKVKRLRNGRLNNLRSRNEEILEVEDEEVIKYKIHSIFLETDRVSYNKFIAIKTTDYKVGKIDKRDLVNVDLPEIVIKILREFEINNVKDLIKFIGKAYGATNDEEFKMFVEILNMTIGINTIGINASKRFEVLCNEENEKGENFWEEANSSVLGSLFVKIRKMKQNQNQDFDQDFVKTKGLQQNIKQKK